MFLLESGSTMLPRNASQPHDRYCAMQLTQFAIQAVTRAPKSNSWALHDMANRVPSTTSVLLLEFGWLTRVWHLP